MRIGDFEALLTRSAELDEALVGLIEAAYPYPGRRWSCARIMCCVSFEHAISTKALIAVGNFTSAVGLLRLQYEALVRATWLTYAASDEWVEKLSAELTAETAKRADKLPLMAEMLGAMEGVAPDVPMSMLREFKEYHWKPLSSFVHGGIHAMQRHGKGYPVHLLEQAIRASNGVALMTGMQWVLLSNNPMLKGAISGLQREYGNCLPPPQGGGD